MNSSSGKFAMFYVAVISVALVGSLYASHLNAWNHITFTFPPETQKIVMNGTAIMEIKWRWLPETLEMIVKVNDDDYNETHNEGYVCVDWLGLLFDSDHSGNLTTNNGNGNDYGVFVCQNNFSCVKEQCYINLPGPGWSSNAVMSPPVSGGILRIVLQNLNDTYCIYNKGYIFYLNIPRKMINVEPPTPIHVSFLDWDLILYSDAHNGTYAYQETIAADFEG